MGKRSLRLAGAVLPALLVAGGANGSCEASDAAVRDVFNRYKAALMSGDGPGAARLVDQATVEAFEELKQLARHGGEQEVRQRSFVDRLLVISMRHALPRRELEGLDFAGLIQTAMTAGWIQPEMISGLDLGRIEVEGDVASGAAINAALPAAGPSSNSSDRDAEAAVRYRFVCEDGLWRFQFSTLLEQLNRMVNDLTEQMGADEDALIFALVEAFSGSSVLPDVWQAPEPEGDGR